MNKEIKTIPLRHATNEDYTKIIADLSIANVSKEMEIIRLNNIIKGLDNTIENLEEVIEHKNNIIKEAKDFIANNSTISGTFGKNGKMIVESIEEIHNGMRLFDILDKAGSDKE
jgi:hypothetical protein